MYSAVSYQSKGAKAPSLGTIKVESTTSVAVPERLVNFSQFSIAEANFPALPKDQLKGVIADILDAVPREQRIIALDRVLASVDSSQIVPRNIPGIKADPPVVFFSTKPAALVNFDSDPIWSPIEANDLKFAVNTNWDVFEHTPTKTYFLRVDQSWMTAPAVKGPWTPVAKLPPSFGKLPADDNWKEVKAALPGKTLTAAQAPTVFVSTTPAEMILMTGEAAYTPVPGTRLLWVNNTESDVFRAGPTGPVYFLVAGRWFSAPALRRSVDVRHARASGRLQAHTARASALARARVGTWNVAGHRRRASRPDSADRIRQQESHHGTGGQLSG